MRICARTVKCNAAWSMRVILEGVQSYKGIEMASDASKDFFLFLGWQTPQNVEKIPMCDLCS